MKTLVTDLEQFEQFKILHNQLAVAIKQIEAYQTRIAVAEMFHEQKALGQTMQNNPEDVSSLNQQMIITMKSVRNRASFFIKEIMDISQRAIKGSKANGKPAPQASLPKPDPVAEAVTTPLSQPEEPEAPEDELKFEVIDGGIMKTVIE